MTTSRRRKAADIKYPITYATNEQAEKDPKAFAFNCGTYIYFYTRRPSSHFQRLYMHVELHTVVATYLPTYLPTSRNLHARIPYPREYTGAPAASTANTDRLLTNCSLPKTTKQQPSAPTPTSPRASPPSSAACSSRACASPSTRPGSAPSGLPPASPMPSATCPRALRDG